MNKRYLVTGNWHDKVTGKPVSGIAKITGGISKATGKSYEMANTDNRETIDGAYPVGTVLVATVNIAPDNTGKVSSAAKSFGSNPASPTAKE